MPKMSQSPLIYHRETGMQWGMCSRHAGYQIADTPPMKLTKSTHRTTAVLVWVGIALGLCVQACAAQTVDTEGRNLHFSGFGTVGGSHVNAPAGWGYRRDLSQPANNGGTRADIDTRLGVQANYSPNPQFEFVGQVIAARRSPYGRESDNIEWAFAAYRPDANLTLRLGRVNTDAFVLAEYRNVGFAYNWVRPPVEFYGALPSSIDGGDITQTWNIGDARWKVKVFGGQAYPGDLSNDGRVTVRPLFGTMLSREADGLLVRAGLIHAKLVSSVPVLQPMLDGLRSLDALSSTAPDVAAQADALRARLDTNGGRVVYATLGATYEAQDWLWSAEFMRVFGRSGMKFTAGYAGVGRRFGPVTVFGGTSHIRTPDEPVATPAWDTALTPVLGPELAGQVQVLGNWAAFAANFGANQHTQSLGARWDVHPQMALKAQWDYVRIGANGGRLWSGANLSPARANVTTVSLDFVF